MAANEQDNQHSQVTSHSKNSDYPGETAQEAKAQQVFARVKGIWLRRALDEGVVKTIPFQVWILKDDVINGVHTICSGLSEEHTDVDVIITIPEGSWKSICLKDSMDIMGVRKGGYVL